MLIDCGISLDDVAGGMPVGMPSKLDCQSQDVIRKPQRHTLWEPKYFVQSREKSRLG